jgi:UV DNA damage endonuclease
MSLQRKGYPCVSLLTGRTTNHDCTLRTATPEKLRALIRQNLDDLRAILAHNLEHGWLLFRIGSSIVPFGSHPVNRLAWWREFRSDLTALGAFIEANGMRVSFHPGQYTVLNSPDPQIVQRAVEELTYSARFLSELGLDASHKTVIHLGGTYGDKPAAMDRFCQACDGLKADLRNRIVVENDERSYTPGDALAISKQTKLPVVFDNLHYCANPGEGELDDLLKNIFATWRKRDGYPKVHFSSQAAGGRVGQHSPSADPVEFKTWTEAWGRHGDFDLMLEAKNKDRALLDLESQL